MRNIIYRDIKETDYQSIKKLINETWSVEKFVKNKKLLDKVLDMFLSICLMDSSFGKIAVKDGVVIGVILGHVQNEKKAYGTVKHILKILRYSFSLLFYSKDDKLYVMEYLKVFKAYKELMKNKKHLFSGNIELLALSEQCRGLGIGKALVDNLFEYVKSKSVKSIYLYTDTACNYGFYDHTGFKRLDSKEITMNLKPRSSKKTIFLYQYQF
ncbi:GNAT family N-acetyltransferase [Clostridium sp. Marseille-QA1073]